MALEDYTSYTEIDPAGAISVAQNTITVTGPGSNTDSQVYADKGASHFGGGNFSHDLEINVTSASTNNFIVWNWVLTNLAGATVADLHGAGAAYVGLTWTTDEPSLGGHRLQLRDRSDGSTNNDDFSSLLSGSTTYYLTIAFNSATGTFGAITVSIYSDSGRTTLVDTLSVTLNAALDARYIYALMSQENFGDGLPNCTIANLNLNEAGGGVTVAVGAASMSLTAFAPTVDATADVAVSPGVSEVALTGQAPAVALGPLTVSPGAVSLTIAGLSPEVSLGPLAIAVGVASLSLAGFAPVIEAGGDRTVSPGTSELAIAGQQPTASLGPLTVSPGAASLSLAGHVPAIVASADVTISVGPAGVILSTFAPGVQIDADITVAVEAAGIDLSGFAPVTSFGPLTVTPGTASLTITGFVPVVISTDLTAPPGRTFTVPAQVRTFTVPARAPNSTVH